MPKRKKADESSIPANVDISSSDVDVEQNADSSIATVEEATSIESDTVSVEKSPDAESTPLSQSEAFDNGVAAVSEEDSTLSNDATEEKPKKRKTRKKSEETTLKGVEEDAQSIEEVADNSDSSIVDSADFGDDDSFITDLLNDTAIEESESRDFVSSEAEGQTLGGTEDLNEQEEGLQLAQRLRSMRAHRDKDEARDVEKINSEQSAVSTSRQMDVSTNASEDKNYFFGFRRSAPKEAANIEKIQMWNALRRQMASGVPIFCRVIGGEMYNGEYSAVCKPIDKRFDKATIFVPYSEADINTDTELSNKQKQTLIERFLLSSVFRVKITNIIAKGDYAEGSIRLADLRTRRDSYFRGISNLTASSHERRIIEKGSIIREGCYIETIYKTGVRVNIFGAHVWIKNSELSHELFYHPLEKFKVGRSIPIKILDLQTDNSNNDYKVRVLASVKALEEDTTIEALKHAIPGNKYTAEICVIPDINSSSNQVLAFADRGFNVIIRTNAYRGVYTEGSKVEIQVLAKNEKYAYADITRVVEYTPEILQ